MSTIAHPFLDFVCLECGYRASDEGGYFRPDSPWLEHERETPCTCGEPMGEEEVTTYQAKCDGCGTVVDDYDGFESMGPTEDGMWECLPDWHHTPAGDFCENCGPREEE